MNKLLSLSLFLLLLCSGCSVDTAEDKNKTLLWGRWDIKEAIRNGKVTEALEGIYFEFSPENKLVSNFNEPFEDRESQFSLKDMVITETSKANDKRTFVIETVDDEKLILATEVGTMNFKLWLTKTK